MPVPDPETANGVHITVPKVTMQTEGSGDRRSANNTQKQKIAPTAEPDGKAKKIPHISAPTESSTSPRPLKRKLSANNDIITRKRWQTVLTEIPTQNNTTPLVSGCRWSSVNWSCAYDCVVTCLVTVYLKEEAMWRDRWAHDSEWAHYLGTSFEGVASLARRNTGSCSQQLESVHDDLRDRLYALNHETFPRFGTVGTAIADIFETVTLPESQLLVRAASLDANRQPSHLPFDARQFPIIPMTSCTPENRLRFSVQEYIESFEEMTTSSLKFARIPALLAFQNPEPNNPLIPFFLPSKDISIPQGPEQPARYKLHTIVYIGGFHFSARILDDQNVWIYNGQKHSGRIRVEDTLDAPINLENLAGAKAHMIYVLSSPI
ncbi:hypothetical protein FA15DRAFT_706652 [Coprinopsis marcescibilis]|uniref:USP domain-containing protein n=1 Tax=Coprinopsis marcescibilis TaxID=230819 RepID=A0A5C3KPW5_COPMA|nr:hypothetical protein FA15DRAFT_706652 [Coprinopsis marcescibilis]